MPTMKDVAREANVSLGTVSNVLNNQNSVSPKNRERVLAAVKKLDYRSNMAARTLKTKMSQNIGLIIPSISNPFYPELARGVEDAANKAGLTVFLCNDDRDITKEHKYIDALISKNVDGLILVKPQISLPEIDDISQLVKVVMVDIQMPEASCYNVVNVDDEAGVLQGMELLHSYMHRDIAFITGLMESDSNRNRFKAYQKFLADKSIPYYDRYVVKGNYKWDGGYSAAKALMALPKPPTAIFAANDLMALGAIKAIQDLGLHVPGDVSVMGFDNVEIANLSTPSLTTINQPKYEMGVVSVEMLLSVLNRDASAQEKGNSITLSTEVVYRNSVGAAPKAK